MMSPNATPQFQLLVVDDDSLIIDSLQLVLPKNWKMTSTQNLERINSKLVFHAAFVDMHLSKDSKVAEGPKIVASIAIRNPKTQIIAMSGDLSMDLMELCLTSGAHKFLAKPLMVDEVKSTLEKIEALWMMRMAENHSGYKNTKWIGTSEKSETTKRQLAELRGENGPILIEGETGTGKEIACLLLNQQEQTKSLIAVNISSISENLFESEIFGHVKGAFTGADQNKIGLAEAANGGDLFLDEIEALPLNQQVKLLRFLETGEIRKVGGKESQIVNCRVIAASNQPLATLVKEGKFREDLLFRLSGKKINLPPLKERKEDIKELVQYFLSTQKPYKNKVFSNEAILTLQNYDWPGNVRELKRICEQVSLMSPLPIIRPQDIEPLLAIAKGNLLINELKIELGLNKLVEEFEKQVIEKALTMEKDMDRLTTLLQVSKSTLYKKIKDYEIEVKS